MQPADAKPNLLAPKERDSITADATHGRSGLLAPKEVISITADATNGRSRLLAPKERDLNNRRCNQRTQPTS